MKVRRRKTSSSADRATAYAEAVLAGTIIAGPHVRNACRRHLDDLKRKDIRFDPEAAARALRFFETKLKLSEGQFENEPFKSTPPQDFIIGSIFGWKRKDGTRRFRRAYIEQGKGNGKSPLAGGIGIYGLMADDEAGAEVYSAGATKDQAAVLFRDAVKMVRKSPDLDSRLSMSGGPGREFNIAYLKTSSFFRPVSRETKKTGSGPRPHFALVDELHEHPDGGIIEILERGFKFRRQPLLLMITNSGSDRNSVCWSEHDRAVKVAAGNPDAKDDDAHYLGEILDQNADTLFSYVCALDSGRTEVYPFDIALRHAAESCTCNAQITLTDLPSPRDFAALATRRSGEQIISQKALGASITPTVLLFLDAFATLATRAGERKTTQDVASSAAPTCEPTQRASEQRNSLVSATPNSGSEKRLPNRRGKQTGKDCGNTGLPQNKLKRSASPKGVDAEFAETAPNVSGWITATLKEMFGDCSAAPAIQESVCSAIMSRLYNEHSNTCAVHQRFHLESGHLAEKLPADDPLADPSCWIKANPLLGVTITEEWLANQVAQGKAQPDKLNGILRLHFCQWTEAETAWMTRSMIEPCLADFDPAEHFEKEIWLGCDLSQNKDITALAAVVKTGEIEVEAVREGKVQRVMKPTFDAWIEAWTPGDTMAVRAMRDKQPYEIWAREKHIHAPKGSSIRYDHVAQAVAEYVHDFDVQCLAYDRYAFGRGFEPECEKLGISLEFVEHPQGGTKKGKPNDAMIAAAKSADREPEGLWMPGSVRELEDAIAERRIRIRKNPVLISAILSAVTDEDRWGNRWIAKERAVNKIDCAVALAMAYGAACSYDGGDGHLDIAAMVA